MTHDLEEVLSMHDAGMSATDIAGELGANPKVIREMLRNAGRQTGPQPAHAQEASICKAYAETDVPAKDILRKFDITYGQLYGILERNDIPMRKHTRQEGVSRQLQEAVEMYLAGMPLWKIKEETGVAQPTLHAHLHKSKITLRRPRKKGTTQ